MSSFDAREYIRSIAGHLVGLYAESGEQIDLNVEVDEIDLDPDSAIPCGLIANELLSNAFQHVFPDAGEGFGEVRVALRSQENGTLELTVGDSGVGLPGGISPETRESLGLRLVQMLTQELGGVVDLKPGKGTTITVAFAPRKKKSAV